MSVDLFHEMVRAYEAGLKAFDALPGDVSDADAEWLGSVLYGAAYKALLDDDLPDPTTKAGALAALWLAESEMAKGNVSLPPRLVVAALRFLHREGAQGANEVDALRGG
jgi:hypothetical protein